MAVKKKTPTRKAPVKKKLDIHTYTVRGDCMIYDSLKDTEEELKRDACDGEEFEIWKLVKVVRANKSVVTLEEVK